jgi:hypothetical protein
MSDFLPQQLIDTWRGGRAMLWEYKVSHGLLVIRVASESKKGSLEIVCLDTEYICGNTRWSNCDLKVEEVNYITKDDIPICFVIKDEKAKFEAHCGAITVTESDEYFL